MGCLGNMSEARTLQRVATMLRETKMVRFAEQVWHRLHESCVCARPTYLCRAQDRSAATLQRGLRRMQAMRRRAAYRASLRTREENLG